MFVFRFVIDSVSLELTPQNCIHWVTNTITACYRVADMVPVNGAQHAWSTTAFD